jgi:hypothetical protein
VTGRGRGVATLGIALAAIPVATLTGQTTATLDAGVSTVRYEGFLASGSFFLTPAARIDLPGATAAAQGTYLVFESGNHIIQGTAAAAWLPAVPGFVRPEFGGSVGLSSYSGAPNAGHVLGRLRFHAGRTTRGAWLGGGLGRSFLGGTSFGSSELGAGAWVALRRVGFALGGTFSQAGDTTYADFTINALWRVARVQVEGLLGARAPVARGGGGEGVYGEGSARITLFGPLDLLLSGGRYPSDPVRGTLAGRFATVGFRLSARPGRQRPSAALVDLLRREPRAVQTMAPVGAPELSIQPGTAGLRIVRVRASSATFVEISGDFTDWEPVNLRRISADVWEGALPIAAGAHRLNVRVDGGAWVVPRGTRLERDEFGGEVGVLVVW